MPLWETLGDILILLSAALVLGTIAEMLGMSAILGYLVAGTAVGPHVLGLISEGTDVATMAELGVAMLLFAIGLEFSFRRLKRLGRVALLGGSLQVAATMTVAAIVAAAFGLPTRAAIAVGAMIALSSTACVLRVLMDRKAIESIYGRNTLGILLLQDVAVIPLMLLLITMGGDGTGMDALWVLGRTVLLGGALVGGFLLVVNVIVPRLLDIEQWARNRELPILLAIIVALGSAAAAHAVELPPAMGAFVAGVLLGGSPFATQIRADVGSLRTLLVTLFFASIGMLGDPSWVLGNWHVVAAVVLTILVGKTLIVWAIVRLLGFRHGLALATGLCLAQVGEFSFVLAELARSPVPLIDPDMFKLIVSATLVTLFITPFLVAAAPRVADAIESRSRGRRAAARPADADVVEAAERDIIIIGFGPAGQAVAQALYNQCRDRMLVIELSPRAAKLAREHGLPVHIGDAMHLEVLERARVERSQVIAITIPDPIACRAIIHQCRRIAPTAAVIARSRYHVHRWELELAGAREVIDEEEHVGLRIATAARRYVSRGETPPNESAT